MAKTPKGPDRPVDDALREAFRAVEAQPVPPALTDQVARISAPQRRPDGRS
jgi:hypothetical protein